MTATFQRGTFATLRCCHAIAAVFCRSHPGGILITRFEVAKSVALERQMWLWTYNAKMTLMYRDAWTVLKYTVTHHKVRILRKSHTVGPDG